jgi:hypothetical protein
MGPWRTGTGKCTSLDMATAHLSGQCKARVGGCVLSHGGIGLYGYVVCGQGQLTTTVLPRVSASTPQVSLGIKEAVELPSVF